MMETNGMKVPGRCLLPLIDGDMSVTCHRENPIGWAALGAGWCLMTIALVLRLRRNRAKDHFFVMLRPSFCVKCAMTPLAAREEPQNKDMEGRQVKGNVKTTIPHPRLMEETDKTLALKVIKELSVSPSQWQYMSLFLYDYIEGERDVNGEYEETFKKIMAFFEKHQIPSTKKYAIINEMDRIVQDIHSTPIRDLVRFKNEQIKTQKLELKRGK